MPRPAAPTTRSCGRDAGSLDVDGDGRTDRTIFRPSTGVWFAALSGGGATATTWGVATDVDVLADYDGDGVADIAVWRPSTGEWWIRQSKTGTIRVDTWGVPGDVPLAGDVDGDRKADLVIYRPSTGQWWAKLSTGGILMANWGLSTDVPLLGDFDGDGKTDFAIYRPSTGQWWIALQTGGTLVVTWGVSTDMSAPGGLGWRREGRCGHLPAEHGRVVDPAVDWRHAHRALGGAGDIPVAGDWDGDGRSDFTIWRPSTGVWFTQYATGGAPRPSSGA